MARKTINEESYDELDLGVLAKAYVANKREADSYKKLCDEEGKQIKRRMEAEDICAIDVGDGKALKRVISTSWEVDKDKLLDTLKEYKVPAIKTVEVVDEEALEKFLYNLNPDENGELFNAIGLCNTKKEVVSLRVVNAKHTED